MPKKPRRFIQASPPPPQSLSEFIARRAIFRFEEAVAALPDTNAASIAVGLNYHVKKGHLGRVRRGLYCRDPEELDPWLVASRITSDAVIAYRSGLQFHLKVRDLGAEMLVLSDDRLSAFSLDRLEFRAVKLDRQRLTKELRDHPAYHGILEVEHLGERIRVTSRERAFVDCLDRPDLSDGLPALADSFFRQRGLEPDALHRYAVANKSAICAARLGLLMQSHRQLSAAHATIGALMKLRPQAPSVFDPNDKRGVLVASWNAIIPEWFLQLRGHRRSEQPKLH